MTDYKQKYIKYKTKYLELSRQIGGINPKTDDKTDNEIRFQNCAIFRLRLRENIELATIDLIYSGEITKKSDIRNYYVSPLNFNNETQQYSIHDEIKTRINPEYIRQNTDDENISITNYIICTHNTRLRCFIKKYFGKTILPDNEQEPYYNNETKNRIIFVTRTCEKKLLFDPKIILKNGNIDIYIVRHGEGVHNASILGKINNDALLTEEGERMATEAGEVLKVYIDTHFKKYGTYGKIRYFDGLFASKLQRTRQTLSFLLGAFRIKDEDKKFIIIPCSHELQKFTESGECDEYNKGIPVPLENRSNCICGLGDNMFCIKTTTIDKQKTEFCINNFGYENDWEHYNKFYSIGNNKEDSLHCRNTNFIEQIILILNK